MSSNKTTNYNLPQWEKDDFIQMDDFNDLTSKLDAALKANADAASQSVTAEQTARANADTALQQNLSALGQNLGTNGFNCRLSTGSYVGAGGYGEENARSLTFDFVPVLIFISSDTACASIGQSFLIRPFTQADGQDGNKMLVTWSDHGVSWYTEKTLSAAQNNKKNCTYYYLALGYDIAEEAE